MMEHSSETRSFIAKQGIFFLYINEALEASGRPESVHN